MILRMTCSMGLGSINEFVVSMLNRGAVPEHRAGQEHANETGHDSQEESHVRNFWPAALPYEVNTSVRADSAMATTAGCRSLRSTEIA